MSIKEQTFERNKHYYAYLKAELPQAKINIGYADYDSLIWFSVNYNGVHGVVRPEIRDWTTLIRFPSSDDTADDRAEHSTSALVTVHMQPYQLQEFVEEFKLRSGHD